MLVVVVIVVVALAMLLWLSISVFGDGSWNRKCGSDNDRSCCVVQTICAGDSVREWQ